MSTNEIARLFHARRSGKWKGRPSYQAKCPSHQDRSPSLSITEGARGETYLHCFRGCTIEEIVAAKGLRLCDLFADEKIDYEVIRQIQVADEKYQADREYRTYLLWKLQKRIEFWRRQSQILGESLANGGRQVDEFHYALAMERRCRKIWEIL